MVKVDNKGRDLAEVPAEESPRREIAEEFDRLELLIERARTELSTAPATDMAWAALMHLTMANEQLAAILRKVVASAEMDGLSEIKLNALSMPAVTPDERSRGFANAVDGLRSYNGITQRELARRLGKTDAAVSMQVSRKTAPQRATIAAYANAFGLTVEQFEKIMGLAAWNQSFTHLLEEKD